jgi:hypothetical protein
MAHEPSPPCAFEQAFIDDMLYEPDVLLFDRLLEIDREGSVVRCRWPTSAAEPLTRAQRAHPVRHPAHVSGALMVHATGTLGFVHAYYVLGLRHREGWLGYGTHMHDVVFRKLVPPGGVIEASCRAVRARLGQSRHFVRYRFEFRHEGELCYESEQSALWTRVDPKAALATAAPA